jgi:hypothetical protein
LYSKSRTVLAIFYVDNDIYIDLKAARTAAEADRLETMVGSIFAIRELGELTDFFGIQMK